MNIQQTIQSVVDGLTPLAQKLQIPADEFKCANCKGIFKKGWSDEEAKIESDALWGNNHPMAVICDDCFKELCPAPSPNTAQDLINLATGIKR